MPHHRRHRSLARRCRPRSRSHPSTFRIRCPADSAINMVPWGSTTTSQGKVSRAFKAGAPSPNCPAPATVMIVPGASPARESKPSRTGAGSGDPAGAIEVPAGVRLLPLQAATRRAAISGIKGRRVSKAILNPPMGRPCPGSYSRRSSAVVNLLPWVTFLLDVRSGA